MPGLSHEQAELMQTFTAEQKASHDTVLNFMHIAADLETTQKSAAPFVFNGKYSYTPVNDFLSVFAPAIKQALNAGHKFNRKAFVSLMTERGFPKDFTENVFNELNEMLHVNAVGHSIENRLLDNIVDTASITESDIKSNIFRLSSTSLLGRSVAVDTLLAVKDRALPFLIDALDRDNIHIREGALYVIGEIGDKSVMPAVFDMINDPSPRVAREAREIVLKLADKSHIEFMTNIVSERADDASVYIGGSGVK